MPDPFWTSSRLFEKKKQRTKKSIQRKRKNSSSPAFYLPESSCGKWSRESQKVWAGMLRYKREKKNATGQDKAIHKFPFKGTILLWEMHLNPMVYGFFSGGGTYHIPPHTIHWDEVRYIFYRSMGFSSAGNVLPVFLPHFDELWVRERARLPLPAEWGLPQVNSPPNFFRRAEKARLCLLYCWWWWWKDEIRRGKTTERMYKNLPKNERFTISAGVVYFFHQQSCHV